MMRNIRISRRYLKAAAAIDILALVLFNIFAVDDAMWLTLTLALPIVLFFVAFRFPDMAYSEALAGVCTFIVILEVIMWAFILVLVVLEPYIVTESSPFMLVLLAYSFFNIICAWNSAVEAVSWIRELREKKKSADSEEGIDSMIKGVIRFLRPRLGMFLLLFALFAPVPALNAFDPQILEIRKDPFLLVLILISSLIALLMLVLMLYLSWSYNRYIKGLKASGALSQVAMEYYKGDVYCEGRVVLGIHYIFMMGEGSIYEYSDFVKYFFEWSQTNRIYYWSLYAVKKDGTKIQNELPYGHTKKNYYEHVYPMINVIRSRSKGIVIEGSDISHL